MQDIEKQIELAHHDSTLPEQYPHSSLHIKTLLAMLCTVTMVYTHHRVDCQIAWIQMLHLLVFPNQLLCQS